MAEHSKAGRRLGVAERHNDSTVVRQPARVEQEQVGRHTGCLDLPIEMAWEGLESNEEKGLSVHHFDSLEERESNEDWKRMVLEPAVAMQDSRRDLCVRVVVADMPHMDPTNVAAMVVLERCLGKGYSEAEVAGVMPRMVEGCTGHDYSRVAASRRLAALQRSSMIHFFDALRAVSLRG